MERWRGKVAVVTGASAGIGLAIAKALIREGLTVVGLARRKDKMLNEMKSIEGPGKFFAKECDITKEKDVDKTFDYIKESFKTIHVLVNNAGMAHIKSFEEADIKELQEVINVNFVGLVHCTKQAIKLMKDNNHEAHIVNINRHGTFYLRTFAERVSAPSNGTDIMVQIIPLLDASTIFCHKVPNIILPGGIKVNMNVYSPTKFAVTSLSEVLTNELVGGKIRVTSLSPGYVRTDIGDDKAKETIGEEITKHPYLKSEDIADAIVYVVGTPPHVQITELIIKPLGEVF